MQSIMDTEINPSQPEARLVDDYGADSMDMMEIADRLEDKFGITIYNDELRTIQTFGDAVALIETRISDAV